MKTLLLRLLAAGCLLVSGCATLSRDDNLAVTLVSIRPLEYSLFETTAELTLRVTNESTRPLVFAGTSHRLYVNGEYVGRAVTSEPLTVPRMGSVTQTLRAHLENLPLMKKAQQLGNARTVAYQIESRLLASDKQGGGTIGTTSAGQLDLSGLLPSL